MSTSRKKLILGGLVTILIFMFLDYSGFFMWSDINSTATDIDIRTGRIRRTRYLLYIPFERTEEDSSLAQVLLPGDVEGAQPNWYRVTTHTARIHHSPHYIYHGAIAQTNELKMIWEIENFTQEEKRESAKQVLRLWQQHGDDYEAGMYIIRLSEERRVLRKTKKSAKGA